MNWNRTNIVLAIVLVLVIALSAFVNVDYSQPNIEMKFPDMVYSPASHAYDPNKAFPDGRTFQNPVPGTIARGETVYHYEATEEDALRAGEELFNPFLHVEENPTEKEDSTDESITSAEDETGIEEAETIDHAALYFASQQRGAEVYRVSCIVCHGGGGAGDGPVTKRGVPPPPSLLTGKSVQMADGQLFHVLTYGQKGMSSFAAELSPENRWDVISHLRSIQDSYAAANPAPEEETTVENDETTPSESLPPTPPLTDTQP